MTADDLTRLRDEIAGVLRDHDWEWTDGFRKLICYCDEFAAYPSTTPDGLPLRSNGQDTEISAIGLHRAHVASVLASSPTVAALIDRVERAERERDELRAAMAALADEKERRLALLLTEGADDGQ